MDKSQYIVLPIDSKSELDDTLKRLESNDIEIMDIVSTENPGNFTKRKQFGRIGLIEMIFAIIFVLGSIYLLNSSYYPMDTGGISEFNIIPLIPITFEVVILFVVEAIFIGFLFYAKLPSKHEKMILENLSKFPYQIIVDKTHSDTISRILDN